MDYDEYREVINGNGTYKTIAEKLLNNETVGIGWTDGSITHLDIIFKLGLTNKYGNFQRGIRQNDLFVSIIAHTSYGFLTDDIKLGDYIQEKLEIYDYTGEKLAELINGIIEKINEKDGEQ